MKNVLIAHQSTIPHYRVPFYNALECLRPDSWRFEVVLDPLDLKAPLFFREPLDEDQFEFPINRVKSLQIPLGNKNLVYQTFWREAAKCDLVIVENAVNNLTYPLCHFHTIAGTRIAYWGHGKDRGARRLSSLKLISEWIKLLLARWSDGFFAYTEGVKRYLVNRGLPSEKVFVLNNTIDILKQRRAYVKQLSKRAFIKQRLGIENKKALLFVGRFTSNKRIDFLLDAFHILHKIDESFHLLMVGSGGDAYISESMKGISYFGPLVELDYLASIYVASDVFVFPGAVGLGPLQALCYDLPVVTIDSSVHMPEVEYLSSENSIVLDASTTPRDYAHAIIDLFNDAKCLNQLQASTWTSINHLTIEKMAQNFIRGVNSILRLGQKDT